jgi:hypothetical protein
MIPYKYFPKEKIITGGARFFVLTWVYNQIFLHLFQREKEKINVILRRYIKISKDKVGMPKTTSTEQLCHEKDNCLETENDDNDLQLHNT